MRFWDFSMIDLASVRIFTWTLEVLERLLILVLWLERWGEGKVVVLSFLSIHLRMYFSQK